MINKVTTHNTHTDTHFCSTFLDFPKTFFSLDPPEILQR